MSFEAIDSNKYTKNTQFSKLTIQNLELRSTNLILAK